MQKTFDKIRDYFEQKGYDWKRINRPLLGTVLVLCAISIFSLWVIGSGQNTSANFKKQLVGVTLGLIVMAFIALVDYHFICRFVIVYYILVTMLVAATRYSPLGTDNGKSAYRWIRLPGFDLQPSELCKLMIIFVLAALLNRLQNKLDTFWPLVLSTAVTSVPLLFILNQPDLSSSLVIVFILSVMIFASGIVYKILVPVLLTGIPIICLAFWYILQPDSNILEDYQIGRIIGFLNPEKYPDIMFQQNHSIDSISSGKLYGKYIIEGSSEIRNYNKVDVTESDFIWSAIGEEFGFIGCVFVICVLAVFIMLCVLVARNAVDYLGKMIAVGISSMFMFQVFANIGVASRMLPNTGLPLPFVSSGLSSLLTYMMAVGVLINIGIQPASKMLGRGFLVKNEPGNLAERKYN